MLYSEAVQLVDDLRPNAYEESTKLMWLRILDEQIYKETILSHADAKDIDFTPGETPNKSDTLIIDDAYAYDVYIPYLQARIDRENGEDGKFNQSATIYNSGLQNWMNYYNRTHTPNGTWLKMGRA